MKQDSDAEVGEVSEAAADVLEGLNGGVEAFSGAVGNGMPEPGEDSRQVGEDYLGDAA